MNELQQHLPTFVDCARPGPVVFNNTEDLLNLDIVKRYGSSDDFSHFALNGNVLMEICDEGFYWRVVGYVKKPEDVNLPKWDGGKYRAKMPSGEKVVLCNKVVMSCGNVLTLKDGTKAENLRGSQNEDKGMLGFVTELAIFPVAILTIILSMIVVGVILFLSDETFPWEAYKEYHFKVVPGWYRI